MGGHKSFISFENYLLCYVIGPYSGWFASFPNVLLYLPLNLRGRNSHTDIATCRFKRQRGHLEWHKYFVINNSRLHTKCKSQSKIISILGFIHSLSEMNLIFRILQIAQFWVYAYFEDFSEVFGLDWYKDWLINHVYKRLSINSYLRWLKMTVEGGQARLEEGSRWVENLQ